MVVFEHGSQTTNRVDNVSFEATDGLPIGARTRNKQNVLGCTFLIEDNQFGWEVFDRQCADFDYMELV